MNTTLLLVLLVVATTTVCADAIATNKWFTVTHDNRKCVSPLCGGYFVSAVNQATTGCADGKKAASCYVAEIELAEALGDLDSLLSTGVSQVLFGSIVPRTYANFGALGVLQAQLAWVTSTAPPATATATATSTTTFFNLTAGTINCIAAPCPPFAASKLNAANSNTPVWSVTPAAVASSLTRQGTIVTGKLTKAGTPNSAVKVSQVYTPYPPQICGGRGLQPCPASQFCNVPEANNCGRADGPGVCTTPPVGCTKEYKPVCGCNGKTYSNPCLAAAAGVSVDYQGACGKQVCGTGLTECRNNGYCSFPKTNKCGSQNPAGGVCAVRPEICTMIYQPVCGCDGNTYSNACSAASAGVSVRKNAAC